MSRYLNGQDVAEITLLLSEPRLSTYLQITQSQKPEDAIELHQATMSLGVALMAVAGLIEIGLRNAICEQLTSVLGVNDWLRSPPPSLKWSALEVLAIQKAAKQAQRAAYSKMSGVEKVALDAAAFPHGLPPNIKHRKVAERRQSTINVSDGQIVAQLTMHFWKRLFSEDYEKALWKRGLKKVFPNKTMSRADIAIRLEVIYETRNRLAHHEPVYGRRLDAILDAIEFVCQNLGSVRPSSENAFSKLVMPQKDILMGQVAIFTSTFDRLK
ncbi:hypothetical protein [Asticcacaulis excentricus]|uniref:hypothetical protein n=1 Tax=Asticcacaulis excentricus TaxID=78587 RepID=UPI000F82AAAA|nr:hypothetical protein [Asticcacaulis excentricus]